MMQAIIISGGINTWWYESGGGQDILIENNTFGDCNYDGGKRPVISVSGKLDDKGRRLGKIIIRNNIFNNFNPSILKAHGVKQLEFTNNIINNSKTFEPTNPDAFVIDVKQIDILKIESVKISEDFKNKVKEEGINKRLAN